MRQYNRSANQMRPITIEKNFNKFVPGSVLISYGDTKVICAASVEEKVPFFLKGTGKGWITAEYSLLPSATNPRASREAKKGKQTGRTHEIQRLIGRSLRTVIDLDQLGERTINIDCDVIQADGGTRTASITGAMVALQGAINELRRVGDLENSPIIEKVAAVSVGIVDGKILCDLDYLEDSRADVDMNIVMTESGKYVEVQGSGEESVFTQDELSELLESANNGLKEIFEIIKG